MAATYRPTSPLQRRNHIHPRPMPAAFEFGGQERVDNIEREAEAYHARTKRKHIGVIVLADHAGGEGVHTHATAYTFDLIGRHHNALTRTAEQNAKPILPCRDKACGLSTPFWIGRAFGRHRADVIHLPALRGHMVIDRAPQFYCGVITGQDEAHGLGHRQDLFAVMVANASLDALERCTTNGELIAVIGMAGQLGELGC
jgi:hypothetical protein